MLDAGLMTVLELQPRTDGLRALYVYESQMGLLTRLASSQKGAQILLEGGLFQRLAEMAVFSQRPEQGAGGSAGDTEADAASFIPDAGQRFRQILFPALQLSCTVLTALGPRHRVASSEVHLTFTASGPFWTRFPFSSMHLSKILPLTNQLGLNPLR